MKYTDHLEYLQHLYDMLPEGHVARPACSRAEYDCYCLNEVRESCVARIREWENSAAVADDTDHKLREQIRQIVQLMDATVDDVRNLVKRDFFLKFIDQDDKYLLACTTGGLSGYDFTLFVYNPYDDGHEKVLSFDFEDVPGLQELEQSGQIGEAHALIEEYMKSKLGFVPDYEVI